MPPSSTWRCRVCKTPLGTIRDGTLTPEAPVVRIGPDGAARVRCSACGAERVWRPQALSDADMSPDRARRSPREAPRGPRRRCCPGGASADWPARDRLPAALSPPRIARLAVTGFGVRRRLGLLCLLAALALAGGYPAGYRHGRASTAHPGYEQWVLEATEENTIRTTLFGGGWLNAPHRVLRTPFVEEWFGQEAPGGEQRPDEPIIGETSFAGQWIPVGRFMSLPSTADASGEVESMALLAGQGVGLVQEITPAGEIVRELVEGARRIIEQRLVRTVVGRPRSTTS